MNNKTFYKDFIDRLKETKLTYLQEFGCRRENQNYNSYMHSIQLVPKTINILYYYKAKNGDLPIWLKEEIIDSE